MYPKKKKKKKILHISDLNVTFSPEVHTMIYSVVCLQSSLLFDFNLGYFTSF